MLETYFDYYHVLCEKLMGFYRYRNLVSVSDYSEHSYAIILLWQESMEAISQLFFH